MMFSRNMSSLNSMKLWIRSFCVKQMFFYDHSYIEDLLSSASPGPKSVSQYFVCSSFESVQDDSGGSVIFAYS